MAGNIKQRDYRSDFTFRPVHSHLKFFGYYIMFTASSEMGYNSNAIHVLC